MNPWKAASLSWLLPGLGQLCIGRWLRASEFFTTYLLLHIIIFYSSLILFFNSIYYWSFIIYLLPLGILSILAGLDASLCVKKLQKTPVDEIQAQEKNIWLAIFLSLVWPGLGHAFLRRWFPFILYSLLYLSIFLLDFYFEIFGLIIRMLACFHICRTFNNIDTKRDFYKFAISAVLLLFTINFIIPRLRARYVVRGDFVASSSMEPALKIGDLFLISQLAYVFDNPQAGDIVEIKSNVMVNLDPQIKNHSKLNIEKTRFFIKRIIAVEGDSVQIKTDGVYVNDTLRKDTMVGGSIGPRAWKVNGLKIDRISTDKPYKVPKDCFFVLGDNIEKSFDSRDFGAVPRDMIRGKIIKVFHPNKEE